MACGGRTYAEQMRLANKATGSITEEQIDPTARGELVALARTLSKGVIESTALRTLTRAAVQSNDQVP